MRFTLASLVAVIGLSLSGALPAHGYNITFSTGQTTTVSGAVTFATFDAATNTTIATVSGGFECPGGLPAGACGGATPPNGTGYRVASFGTITITFPRLMDYFGLVVGTPDDFNTISFYRDGLLIPGGRFTGNDVSSDGFTNFIAQNPGEFFNSITLSSGQCCFEVDNLAARIAEGGACALSLSPAAERFGTDGGLGSFVIDTAEACSWSVTTDSSWITLLKLQRGRGAGTVFFTVANNAGGRREATISVGVQRFNVDQDGFSCASSIAPAHGSVDDLGGSLSVLVTAPAACAWTATSNDAWLAVTSGRSGSGTRAVTIQIARNTGAARTGTVTIAGGTFTVAQGAGACGALDVTRLTQVTASGFTYLIPSSYDYLQSIKVQNISQATIRGPIYLALIGVPNHQPFPYTVTLVGPQIGTRCFSPQGDYLEILSGGDLQPQQTVSLPAFLWFHTPGLFPIHYVIKVLSGQPAGIFHIQ